MAVSVWLFLTALRLIFAGFHLSGADNLECRPWSVDGMSDPKGPYMNCSTVSTFELTWPEARDFCRNNGGYLTVSSTILEDFIYMGTDDCWFIGLSRDPVVGWKWLDGSPLTLLLKVVNADDPLRSCVARCHKPLNSSSMSWSSWWTAEHCDRKLKFICEYDPTTPGRAEMKASSSQQITSVFDYWRRRSSNPEKLNDQLCNCDDSVEVLYLHGHKLQVHVSRIAMKGFLINEPHLFEKRAYAATMCSRFCKDPCRVFNYNTKTGHCRGFVPSKSKLEGGKNSAWDAWVLVRV